MVSSGTCHVVNGRSSIIAAKAISNCREAMATATLKPQLSDQATPALATAALPKPPTQQMASVNPTLPAVDSPAGVATAPPSRLQAQVTGAPYLAGAAAGATGPPHNWSLRSMDIRPGAAPPREGAPSLAGPSALVTAGMNPPANWSMPATSVTELDFKIRAAKH